MINESNRDHGVLTKMLDYAVAGIPEYWIIDPKQRAVSIYRLTEDRYTSHGKFEIGTLATSPTLPGLSVDVADLFRQAEAQA